MIEKITFVKASSQKGFAAPPSIPLMQQGFQDDDKNYAKLSGALLHSYYVSSGISFKGSNKKEDKLKIVREAMTDKSAEIYKSAQKLAKKYQHDTVQQIHVLRVYMDVFLDTIKQLDNGEIIQIDDKFFASPGTLEERFGSDIFSDKKKRNVLKDIFIQESKILDKKLSRMPKAKKTDKMPQFSKKYLNDIYINFKNDNTPDSDGIKQGTDFVHDEYLLSNVLWPASERVSKELSEPFIMRLSEKLMKYRKEKYAPMAFFEDKSKEVWKNLNYGTNMFILYEPEMETSYMLDTFESSLKNKDENLGKFNKNNTTLLRYNKHANVDYILEEIRKGIKDKNRNYVFVFDYHDVNINHADLDSIDSLSQYFTDKQKYPNLRFVITAKKDEYYDKISSSDSYKDFSPVTIPIINVENAKKMFKSEKSLMSEIKKEFSPKAIDRVIEASDKMDGYFPKKAQRALGLVARYYTNKDKISEKDAVEYIKGAKEVFKTVETDDSSVKVIMDTGIKLKDIVGFKTNKKVAESLVKQIKNKSIGTKGIILYSMDGTSGAGRRHTAKAVAGEAKIPFLEINAIDFGTKDVNIFSESSSTPEGAIKKLFSMAKAQAEINPHQAIMLYIKNFEYFSCGEQVTEYHEKAMSQLLKEMEIAKKQGLNIIVMGSVSNPDLIGDSTKNSDMFNKKIGIESPRRNKDARFDIIEYFIKQNKIKLNALNESDKKEMIDSFAKITEGSTFVDLKSIVSEFKNIANERGKKAADRGDFIEALLQSAYGMPNINYEPKYIKEMTTSHECGHAVNFTIMNEITKSIHPWYESSKVGFVTLDPRAYYGGCVVPSYTENREINFHNIFADLVTFFGGGSCENKFYDVDGSYGITADMEYATQIASEAVGIMGIGHYFGKKSMNGCFVIDEKDKHLFNKDLNIFLRNAQLVSDMIAEEYSDFIKQFTDKYSSKVGTGECVVDGDQFRKELNEWRAALPENKKQDLLTLNELIKDIMIQTKKGVLLDGSDNESQKSNIIVLQ